MPISGRSATIGRTRKPRINGALLAGRFRCRLLQRVTKADGSEASAVFGGNPNFGNQVQSFLRELAADVVGFDTPQLALVARAVVLLVVALRATE
jgi:hypothetical protein